MKITDVRCVQLVWHLDRVQRNSCGARQERRFTLVLLETDAGLIGLGDAFGDPLLLPTRFLTFGWILAPSEPGAKNGASAVGNSCRTWTTRSPAARAAASTRAALSAVDSIPLSVHLPPGKSSFWMSIRTSARFGMVNVPGWPGLWRG
jgi:L-alanine-DL-glutamate epimerase-like enolase superfamily enzyme